MIVIESRHGIHADAGLRQSTGDCRQKAYRFKRGMTVSVIIRDAN
jgi:hypothetical protein